MDFTSGNSYFGLDISDRSLRFVELKKRGKKFVLTSFNSVEVPPEVIIGGEIKNPTKLIELIKSLVKVVKGKKLSTKNVISVLPETKTFIKVIDVEKPVDPEGKKNKRNKKEKEDLPELIKEEIKNHIPLNIEEIYLDWQILKENSSVTKILIGAVPKEISDSYFSVLEKSGLTPYALEIEAAPIIRSLVPQNDEKAKIIIDFGAMRTGLIVYDQGTVPFTVSLPISGTEITQTIAETLKIDLKKAEQSKIVCGLDEEKCEGALLKILMQPIDKMAQQIQKAIIFYQTNFPQSNQISEVVLCGGGANFIKIDKVLSEKVGLPVKIGDPLGERITLHKKAQIPKNKILSFTTAIGLALNDLQD